MTSRYRSFIKGKSKQIFFVSLAVGNLSAVTFYQYSEVNWGFAALWFFVVFALTAGLLVILHSILYLLFGRHLNK